MAMMYYWFFNNDVDGAFFKACQTGSDNDATMILLPVAQIVRQNILMEFVLLMVTLI